MSSVRVGSTLALCAALAAWAGASGCGRLGYDALGFIGDGGPGSPDAPASDGDAAPGTADAAPGTIDAAPPADAPPATGTDEIALTTDLGDSGDPAIAYTGDGYSVVWSDTRNGTGNSEIYLQRVVGGALSGGNLRLTNATGYSGFPAVAWSGSELALGWEDSRLMTRDEVFFARFDKAGGSISPQVPLSSAFGRAYDPWVVWTGSDFGVVWEDGSNGTSNADVYFVSVDPAAVNPGVPVRRTNVAGNSELPVAVWTGSDIGLAWEDQRSGQFEVFFARSDAAGAPVGTDPPSITSSTDAGEAYFPSLAWNGTSYAIAYEDNRTGTYLVYVTAVLPDGTRTGADVPISSGGVATEATIVWAGDHWAVSYMQGRQIWIVALSSLLLPGTPRAVSSASGNATGPRMVWTGSAYGVTWQDRRAGNWDIYFREVLP